MQCYKKALKKHRTQFPRARASRPRPEEADGRGPPPENPLVSSKFQTTRSRRVAKSIIRSTISRQATRRQLCTRSPAMCVGEVQEPQAAYWEAANAIRGSKECRMLRACRALTEHKAQLSSRRRHPAAIRADMCDRHLDLPGRAVAARPGIHPQRQWNSPEAGRPRFESHSRRAGRNAKADPHGSRLLDQEIAGGPLYRPAHGIAKPARPDFPVLSGGDMQPEGNIGALLREPYQSSKPRVLVADRYLPERPPLTRDSMKLTQDKRQFSEIGLKKIRIDHTTRLLYQTK